MSENYPLLSIIVPVFNEEEVIETFYQELSKILKGLPETAEVLFIDDGSRDQTLSLLQKIQKADSSIKVLELSRNFGHQNAMTAGLEHAQGKACVVMDADLQDPPRLIPSLLNEWRKGFDVVYAVRQSRTGESLFKKMTALLFYRVIRKLSGVDIPVDTGDFRLMDRKVIDALCGMPEKNRFIRGLISWVGFKQTGVFFDRPERVAGETKFSLWKMMRFALDGITSFSRLPLRFITIAGLLCFLGSLGVLGWAFYVRFVTHETVQGWTSLMAVILFLGSVQMLALGIMGEYMARLFEEVKSRPTYLVRRGFGFQKVKNKSQPVLSSTKD